MNTTFADRVLGHLSDRGGYCAVSESECIRCRRDYRLDFSERIAGVLEFPAVLPEVLENPKLHLPDHLPAHRVLIALAVHEEILVSLLQALPIGRGIVVPIEESDWISPHGIEQITRLCEARNIEAAFPKPFCAFDPPRGTVLDEFRRQFRIGRPEIELKVNKGTVTRVRVQCSAPCGATYYTARHLEGRRADRGLELVADGCLSCYPCTAGHMVDREFKDSIMHQACRIQREVVHRELVSTRASP